MTQKDPAIVHIPEHGIAKDLRVSVVVTMWVMLAGMCVIVANAWAMGFMY